METHHQHPIAQALLATDQIPELGAGPRSGISDLAGLQKQMDEVLPRASAKSEALALVRSLVLLWHDHLDASHDLSQVIPSADGSYVHGIMHRREPDYGNAAYWFRKVGDHPAFGELAKRVAVLLDARKEQDLKSQLLPGGKWDPFAFLDACEAAERGSQDERRASLLREIQAIEFEVLLERFGG